MSIYKYVAPDGALRYLTTQAMRITPPDQFNDPFEMRPTFDLSGLDFMAEAPLMVRQELAATFVKAAASQGWGQTAEQPAAISNALVSFLMRDMSTPEEIDFLEAATRSWPPGAAAKLQAMRAQFDALYKEAMSNAAAQLPAFSRIAQTAMHNALPRHIGVLCLSGSSQHPLMWAHYTDCHKGALLEFDETAPCFNRRRHAEDEFGHLHRVWHADARPTLAINRDANAFVAMALTKALEWAYEQELRLLWPLEHADRTVGVDGSKVHLIDVPITALRSITIGCKASEAFVVELLQTVDAVEPGIKVRAAAMADHSFSLNYRDLA